MKKAPKAAAKGAPLASPTSAQPQNAAGAEVPDPIPKPAGLTGSTAAAVPAVTPPDSQMTPMDPLATAQQITGAAGPQLQQAPSHVGSLAATEPAAEAAAAPQAEAEAAAAPGVVKPPDAVAEAVNLLSAPAPQPIPAAATADALQAPYAETAFAHPPAADPQEASAAVAAPSLPPAIAPPTDPCPSALPAPSAAAAEPPGPPFQSTPQAPESSVGPGAVQPQGTAADPCHPPRPGSVPSLQPAESVSLPQSMTQNPPAAQGGSMGTPLAPPAAPPPRPPKGIPIQAPTGLPQDILWVAQPQPGRAARSSATQLEQRSGPASPLSTRDQRLTRRQQRDSGAAEAESTAGQIAPGPRSSPGKGHAKAQGSALPKGSPVGVHRQAGHDRAVPRPAVPGADPDAALQTPRAKAHNEPGLASPVSTVRRLTRRQVQEQAAAELEMPLAALAAQLSAAKPAAEPAPAGGPDPVALPACKLTSQIASEPLPPARARSSGKPGVASPPSSSDKRLTRQQLKQLAEAGTSS